MFFFIIFTLYGKSRVLLQHIFILRQLRHIANMIFLSENTHTRTRISPSEPTHEPPPKKFPRSIKNREFPHRFILCETSVSVDFFLLILSDLWYVYQEIGDKKSGLVKCDISQTMIYMRVWWWFLKCESIKSVKTTTIFQRYFSAVFSRNLSKAFLKVFFFPVSHWGEGGRGSLPTLLSPNLISQMWCANKGTEEK